MADALINASNMVMPAPSVTMAQVTHYKSLGGGGYTLQHSMMASATLSVPTVSANFYDDLRATATLSVSPVVTATPQVNRVSASATLPPLTSVTVDFEDTITATATLSVTPTVTVTFYDDLRASIALSAPTVAADVGYLVAVPTTTATLSVATVSADVGYLAAIGSTTATLSAPSVSTATLQANRVSATATLSAPTVTVDFYDDLRATATLSVTPTVTVAFADTSIVATATLSFTLTVKSDFRDDFGATAAVPKPTVSAAVGVNRVKATATLTNPTATAGLNVNRVAATATLFNPTVTARLPGALIAIPSTTVTFLFPPLLFSKVEKYQYITASPTIPANVTSTARLVGGLLSVAATASLSPPGVSVVAERLADIVHADISLSVPTVTARLVGGLFSVNASVTLPAPSATAQAERLASLSASASPAVPTATARLPGGLISPAATATLGVTPVVTVNAGWLISLRQTTFTLPPPTVTVDPGWVISITLTEEDLPRPTVTADVGYALNVPSTTATLSAPTITVAVGYYAGISCYPVLPAPTVTANVGYLVNVVVPSSGLPVPTVTARLPGGLLGMGATSSVPGPAVAADPGYLISIAGTFPNTVNLPGPTAQGIRMVQTANTDATASMELVPAVSARIAQPWRPSAVANLPTPWETAAVVTNIHASHYLGATATLFSPTSQTTLERLVQFGTTTTLHAPLSSVHVYHIHPTLKIFSQLVMPTPTVTVSVSQVKLTFGHDLGATAAVISRTLSYGWLDPNTPTSIIQFITATYIGGVGFTSASAGIAEAIMALPNLDTDYLSFGTWEQDANDSHVFRSYVTNSDATTRLVAAFAAITHAEVRWYLYESELTDLSTEPLPWNVINSDMVAEGSTMDGFINAFIALVAAVEAEDDNLAVLIGRDHGIAQIKEELGIS